MFPTRSSCGRILIHTLRETERDWDKELADDVKVECENKYGKVEAIKVERETQVCPCY
jgi:RNA-binding protein 39